MLEVGTEVLEAVDGAVLERLREETVDGESDLVPELIEAFLEEVPDSCKALGVSVSAGDAAEVRRRAHHLRSSTSNLGAVGMTELCKQLEELARTGSLTGAEELARGLATEVDRVERYFKRYLEAGS